MQGHFPVLVRTGDNGLAVVFRTGAPHIGISATLATSTSSDGGRSWSDPIEVARRWDDNRNPSLGVNADGELVLAYWRARLHAYKDDDQGSGLTFASDTGIDRGQVPALFYGRSADGGRTWTEHIAYSSELLTLASPYGRMFSAPDGTLLMPAYGSPRNDTGCRDMSVLLRSTDGGRSWGDESVVACGHNETSYALLEDGRLVAASRSESGHIAVIHSNDMGRTWSEPRQLTRDGEHPADLTLLQSGRLLLTFGRRIRPFGCGALLSNDGGETWDTAHEVLLAGDGVLNEDLGYPSTVQLADGHIVTVLYYASGSQMTKSHGGWGDVSCQALHYREPDIV